MLWARGFAQKGSDSSILFEEALAIYFWNVQLGAPITDTPVITVCVSKRKLLFFQFKLLCALFLFQSLSLSFPDYLMLEDQLSCLSSHLPEQSLASQAMTGAVAVVMDDFVSSGRVGGS